MKTVIVVSKRSDDFHACLAGHPEIWGCGKSVYSAVGDLVTSHREIFAIEIQCADQETAQKHEAVNVN